MTRARRAVVVVMYFNAVSRAGQTVDSGVLSRRKETP
jgi:hypothetical protein